MAKSSSLSSCNLTSHVNLSFSPFFLWLLCMSHLFLPSLFLQGGLNISSSHSAQKDAFWTIFWLFFFCFLIYIVPEKLHLFLCLWFFSWKTLLLGSSTTHLITCYMAPNSANKEVLSIELKSTSFPLCVLLMKGHRINSTIQAWILSIIIIFIPFIQRVSH